MKKEITLIICGMLLGLMIAGFLWLHFRVRTLEGWVNSVIVSSQRQQQTQRARPQIPEPVQ